MTRASSIGNAPLFARLRSLLLPGSCVWVVFDGFVCFKYCVYRAAALFRKVGTHWRVRFEDVLHYKEAIDGERRKVLDELAAEAQELGMGY